MSFAAVLRGKTRRERQKIFAHDPVINQTSEGFISFIRFKTTAASLNAKAIKSLKQKGQKPANTPNSNTPSSKTSPTLNIPSSKAKTSKILSEVREISTGTSKKSTQPESPSSVPKSASPNQFKSSKATVKSPLNIVSPDTNVRPQSTIPTSQKTSKSEKKNKNIKINQKSLKNERTRGPNNDIRSSFKYKSVSRRVTLAIVGLPIVLVTSWMLYQRLILGEQRKELVPPGVSRVEENRATN